MDLSPETLRAEFRTLSEQAASIRAQAAPLRDARDKHIAKAKTREDEMSAAIKEIEAPLFDLDNRRAILVRALGGKTGEPSDGSVDVTEETVTA